MTVFPIRGAGTVVVGDAAGYVSTKATPFDAGFCNLMPAIAVQFSLSGMRRKSLRINAIPKVAEWRSVSNFATLEGPGFPQQSVCMCA
jgi:hypothetical protein